MDQTSILLGKLQIFEPVTVLTDLLLAGFCFYWAGAAKRTTGQFWTWHFFLLGLTFLIGGFAHGYYDYVDNPIQLISRVVSMFAVSAGAFAGIVAMQPSKAKVYMTYITFIQLVVFVSLVLVTNKFIWVTVHSVIGLGLILGGIFATSKDFFGQEASYNMLLGIFINFSTAFIHTFKISVHNYFNYNDLSHLILIVGIFFMFRGSQALFHFKTQPETSTLPLQ